MYSARVVRVVDGDTLDVDIEIGFNLTLRERVRLYGINAPETRSSDKIEKSKGMLAENFLVETLLDAQNYCKLDIHGSGKFGRPLADVFVDGVNINLLLIKKGHAVAYFGGKR